MCLIALLRSRPDAPLVVAANRDELHARPATALEVLEPAPHRLLGGRDLVAGGTWLAAGDHGVVVALTNRPGPRDLRLRSRGDLPLLGAREASAQAAADVLARIAAARTHGPCWLVAADRTHAFWVDASGAGPPGPHAITAEIFAVENAAPDTPSTKAARTVSAVGQVAGTRLDLLPAALHALLGAHDAAPGEPATRAACVHAGPYGTRSSTIVVVPPAGPPRIWVTAGPPCTTALVPAADLLARV